MTTRGPLPPPLGSTVPYTNNRRTPANNDLIEALLKAGTRESIEACLAFVTSLPRFFNQDSDFVGMKDLPPILMMRLGREQEAYALAKLTGFQYRNPPAQLAYMPWLERIKKANLFETVDWAMGEQTPLAYIFVVMLVKVKLLDEIKNLNNLILLEQVLGPRINSDIIDAIRDYIPTIRAFNERHELRRCANFTTLEAALMEQMKRLFFHACRYDKNLWYDLIDPKFYRRATPKSPLEQTLWETKTSLRCCYQAWYESRGGIEIIRGLVKRYFGKRKANEKRSFTFAEFA
ncbi:hypothetical protein ABW19_dt0208442 [Dactylella cylindrospora]|nr:hypothetical protein ABW19_dt0208442 [Dactylella cylindrospora]